MIRSMRQLALLAAVLALGCGGSSKDTPAPAPAPGSGTGAPAKPSPPRGEPTSPAPPPIVKSGKGDCKTQYAPSPKRDPNPMCKVAGGTVTIGKMVAKVSPFLIDQLEVTNAQVAHYLNATKGEDCAKRDCFAIGDGSPGSIRNKEYIARSAGGDLFAVVEGKQQLPAQYVTKRGAELYCAWAGKMLPTDVMWVAAAALDASGKQLRYPWGDAFDGKRARCALEACPDSPWTKDQDPTDSLPAPVGTYDGSNGHGDGRATSGALDMAGNVAEIVADCEHPESPCKDGPCVDPEPHLTTPCLYEAFGGALQNPDDLITTSRGRSGTAGFRCAKR